MTNIMFSSGNFSTPYTWNNVGKTDIIWDIEPIDDGDLGDVKDNGFVAVGYTDQINGNQSDGIIVRFDASGNVLWGGSPKIPYTATTDKEIFRAVEQIAGGNGNLIVCGTKKSTHFGPSSNWNVWFMEINLSTGVMVPGSEFEFGSTGDDRGFDIKEDVANGYYVIAGHTGNYLNINNDLIFGQTDIIDAGGDYWVIQVNPSNSYAIPIKAQYNYGGTYISNLTGIVDIAHRIIVANGHYEVAGSCFSCEMSEAYSQLGIFEIDPNILSLYTLHHYGYLGHDQEGWDIISTADGGYFSSGIHHPAGCNGSHDFYGIKLLSNWMDTWIPGCQLDNGKNYGGSLNDDALCSVQTCDGGFLIVGNIFSTSGSGDVTCNNDGTGTTTDMWIVKVKADGTFEWDESLGSYANPFSDKASSIKRVPDGSYIHCRRDWNIQHRHT